MAASRRSPSVRIRGRLAALAAALSLFGLLAPGLALAAAPGARTSALTALEEALIVTEDMEPAESRLPVIGYLHRTEDGWRLDMLPGAVPRTGPLPVLTNTAEAALEDMTSQSLIAGPQQFRVDF
jgi:hypothetical protein